MTALPAIEPDSAGSDDYAENLHGLLARLWRNVLGRRAPHVANWFDAGTSTPIPEGDAAIPYLQALTTWFQLHRIAEENIAIRARRQLETANGVASVPGTFAEAFAHLNLDAGAFADLAETLSVGPTITAHPTEAKRVTVLEIHRRTYRRLVKLETDRWTAREKAEIESAIESDIDLLWMTGELRLERPLLKDEIEWGLQFFRDSIFDAVPQVFDAFEKAASDAFGAPPVVSPCIRFHSWIGGDRDGNPNVNTETTELALESGRSTALACYAHF